jgi:hypothetical protein
VIQLEASDGTIELAPRSLIDRERHARNMVRDE